VSLSAGIERSAAGLVNLGGAELGLFQGGVGELTASALPVSLVARVARRPGVAEAAPIAVAAGELPGSQSFLIFGVEPDIRRPSRQEGADLDKSTSDSSCRTRNRAIVA
jgi:hypothetical protein